MTLWELELNSECCVTEICQNCGHSSQLESFGFFQNQKVKFLFKTPFGGPKVYQVGDSVLSLCKQLASQILVSV